MRGPIMQPQVQIDEARLEAFRSRRRGLAASVLGPLVAYLVFIFLVLPLLDGRLPASSDLSGRRLVVGLIGAGLLALLSGAVAFRMRRDTLRMSLADHRRALEQDWAKWVGPHWRRRVFRAGFLMTLGVGIPIGLLLALTSAPSELPAGSQPLMLLLFVGLTALWAFPFALGLRWQVLRGYRDLGRER